MHTAVVLAQQINPEEATNFLTGEMLALFIAGAALMVVAAVRLLKLSAAMVMIAIVTLGVTTAALTQGDRAMQLGSAVLGLFLGG